MKKSKKSKSCPVFVSIASNKGRARTVNEDNFYADILGIREIPDLCGHRVLNHSDRYIFGVCDGMGGEQFGDTASEIAVGTMREFSDRIKKSELKDLHNAVNEYAREANRRICRMAWERSADMSGSTFVIVCVRGSMVYPFSMGDSRIYFRTGSELHQISEDQTVAAKKRRDNIYSEEEARLSPDAHKITTFLGVDSENIGLKALACEPLDLSRGEVLLCSDGLTDMCTNEEIRRCLIKYGDEFAAQHLVELALKNGGKDNVTCMVIRKA